MIKLLQKTGLMTLLLLMSSMIYADNTGKTYQNETATIQWAFTGNTTDAATVTPEGVVSLATFSHGDDIADADGSSYDNISYTRFQPVSGTNDASEAATLEWSIKPTKGLTFTPTLVSANVRRFGTDGGKFDVKVINGEGIEETLATGLIPARNKATAEDKTSSDPNYRTSFTINVPASLATSTSFKLVIYVYGLGNTKQIGFNDVKIEGTVNGTTEAVTMYTLNTEVSPAEAGTIKVYPNGNEFEAGTTVNLTASRNFGYKFVNWTDANGQVIATNNEIKYTLNTAEKLTANFEKINTYSLDYTVEGGAADYMVQPDIAPVIVDNKKMYEEGTEVTLTASSNEILTFTNWSNGESSADIKFVMNADQAITAHYSAKDYIVAWDMYKTGNNGRKADFASADNDADQLVLRDADGNTYGWLDKSAVNGGYEGRPACVNWMNNAALGTYYWQIKFNAANYTNIQVKSAMAYNYNAYQTYHVEYSLDQVNWNKLGAITMPSVKSWTDATFNLPEEANNKSEIYIRWIADKTSAIDGTESNNDGNAIGAIYILGTEKLVNDGIAPKLVNSVPAESATNASANGKIVLTFDEKIKLTEQAQATLNGQKLEGTVSGNTITFAYKGLNYTTTYQFNLAAGSVSDLTDNTITETITIKFTTKTKPAISKKLYDFIIPDDGTFREAIAAATNREDKATRFRIFVKKGTYVIPVSTSAQVTGSDGKTYNSVTTVLSANNVSIIGEDMTKTIIKNDVPYELVTGQYGPACPIEGIGKCDLLQITGNNTYLEDITFRNGTDDATGRNLAIQEKGDKTIYKNVTLYGYQDTWTCNAGGRYYFEDGIIRGRTDYICGKGDAFFNGVTFQNVAGGYIAVPSQPKKYGWILSQCIIKGETDDVDGNYTLGRPWGSGTPIALWINTKMIAQPSAIGWNEMSGGYPARFAEYNSTTATGTVIDLTNRKTVFADTHTNNPILTAEEAATYTIETVMGGDDEWDPTAATEQASAPTNVIIKDNKLTWDNSDYALLWAIEKDGNVVDFTTLPEYDITGASSDNVWAVRAANEMGGLGDATIASTTTSIKTLNTENEANITGTSLYSIDGTQQTSYRKGVNIVVKKMENGNKKIAKIIVK